MTGRLSKAERAALVLGLDDRAAAVYRRLEREPLIAEAQIAPKLKATVDQIRPALAALIEKGLVEKYEPTKRRPFGALYRPTPDRIETVGDWLNGGAADRGYADLAAIQRDYPSVTSLADPADGAEAARAADERIAKAKAQAMRQAEEAKARQEEREARLAAQREERAIKQNGGKP